MVNYYKNKSSMKKEKMVSKFLTEKQINSIEMVTTNFPEKKVNFEIVYQDKNLEIFETKTGGDDIHFKLEFISDRFDDFNLIIEIGIIGVFSTTTLYSLPERKLEDLELELIKSLIKHFTESIGNSVYIK
jgi:acid stress-induced BolA-like protein IbaG/YrbA